MALLDELLMPGTAASSDEGDRQAMLNALLMKGLSPAPIGGPMPPSPAPGALGVLGMGTPDLRAQLMGGRPVPEQAFPTPSPNDPEAKTILEATGMPPFSAQNMETGKIGYFPNVPSEGEVSSRTDPLQRGGLFGDAAQMFGTGAPSAWGPAGTGGQTPRTHGGGGGGGGASGMNRALGEQKSASKEVQESILRQSGLEAEAQAAHAKDLVANEAAKQKDIADAQLEQQRLRGEADSEYQDIRKMNMEMVATDPMRAWKQRSAGSKVLAAIGIAMSAASQTLLRGQGVGAQNMALKIIEGQLERDLEAQKMDAQDRRARNSNAVDLYRTNLDRLKNQGAADSALRAAKWESVAHMAEAQAQLRESPIAREKATGLAAAARQKSAEFDVKTQNEIWGNKLQGWQIQTSRDNALLAAQVEREKMDAGKEGRNQAQELKVRELAIRDPRAEATGKETILAHAYKPEDATQVRDMLAAHARLSGMVDKFLKAEKEAGATFAGLPGWQKTRSKENQRLSQMYAEIFNGYRELLAARKAGYGAAVTERELLNMQEAIGKGAGTYISTENPTVTLQQFRENLREAIDADLHAKTDFVGQYDQQGAPTPGMKYGDQTIRTKDVNPERAPGEPPIPSLAGGLRDVIDTEQRKKEALRYFQGNGK